MAPSATHGEVGILPGLLTALNDGSPTTLGDIDGPLGPGNLTFAFQWDFTIDPNGSALISKTKLITVPEPTAAALVSLGLVALALRRRS